MKRLTVIALCVLTILLFANSFAETPAPYAAPALDKTVPASLDLPEDFKPPKDGKRNSLWIPRIWGVALEKQGGTYPIYISESDKGSTAGNSIVVGDVLLAVNGKALGKDPVKDFRLALKHGKETTGVMWFTRWRKGARTQHMIDLGTRQLDLRKSGTAGNTRDWALGPIGANGWGFSKTTLKGASLLTRQLIITLVEKGTPADGVLHVGDVILGVGGSAFSSDARRILGAAINEAEKKENKGALKLLAWRKDKEIDVTVTLPVMGSYSKTAPFDCPKTDKIINDAVEYMKRNKDTLLEPKEQGWINYINALGLLATGREDVMPMVREFAHASLLKEGETLSIEKHESMMCWWWSYKTIFLCEYYLRTGDKAVLPTIEEFATKIAMGQSGAGTWGHTYAAIENTGYLHGNLGGYGAINQQGLTLMIALPLAEKCGVRNKEVLNAIKRGDNFFSYFIGRGTIPYGDHGAASGAYDDNGKSGAAAIFFDLMGNREGAEFFSDMVLGYAPSGREDGHTGHFWSHLWGGMGAARGGDRGLQAFMKEMSHIFTLERQPDGRMAFQRNIGENGEQGKRKDKWDCTGTRLLQLCIPRRALYITGKDTPRKTHLTDARIEQMFAAGRLNVDQKARAALSEDEIFALLRDPLPPTRSIGARALAERKLNCVDRLVVLLESDNRYAQYGAAEALRNAGFGSKKAADRLIALMQTSDDVTFQTYAIAALVNRNKELGLLSVAKPARQVLLKMALKHSPKDPRRVLQQSIALALFYSGRAQKVRGLLPEYGLEGLDRSLLVPVVREILVNENGGSRSLVSQCLYKLLTKEELDELWGDIYQSARYIAPSGIMFASGNRLHGLDIMAENHIKEGLDLAVWYVRHQKGHGSGGRVPNALASILRYGSHAKRVIPDLEKHIAYWESLPKSRHTGGYQKKADLVRDTIKKIKALPDEPTFALVSIAEQMKNMRQ